MNTASRNAKNSACADLAMKVTAPALPSLLTDLMRFLAFAVCLACIALALWTALAPLGTRIAASLLAPHAPGQALGMV